MKEKISQKGFIPIILIIVIAVVVVSTTAGIVKYKDEITANVSKVFKSKIETPNIESIEEDEGIEESELTEEPIIGEEAETEEKQDDAQQLQEQLRIAEQKRLEAEKQLAGEKAKQEVEKAKAEAEETKRKTEEQVRIKAEQELQRELEAQKLAEEQKPYVAPPTLEQLSNLRRVCLWDVRLKAICNDPNFMPGYYSNLVFRTKLDDMIKNFLAAMSDQQKQRIAAEKQIMDCLLTPSPEEERLLDPDTKMYLLQLRCGTVTAADRTNYELSRLKSSVDELKYRLDSKISFPSLLLDPIPLPMSNTTRWQIRWEGSGGTITDSNGNFYQFHCEDNTCRSY